MSSLKQVANDLLQLDEQLGDVSNIKEAKSRAQADLDSMNQLRDRARAEMSEAQNLLTQAQAAAQRQFEQDMFNKQGALRDLTARVRALEARAKELSDVVSEKEGQLRAIDSAMNDARRRLAS
jgi:chromosome segregation ATPase